ncbi:MAG: hypothetical protein K5917_03720 [Clostridiales bacterium]|nr:hypothetical protein [Clostridiales bacterium]
MGTQFLYIQVNFDDGKAETKLTIKGNLDDGKKETKLNDKEASNNELVSTKTADNSHLGMCIAIMCLSLCGLAVILFISKKKRVFDR